MSRSSLEVVSKLKLVIQSILNLLSVHFTTTNSSNNSYNKNEKTEIKQLFAAYKQNLEKKREITLFIGYLKLMDDIPHAKMCTQNTINQNILTIHNNNQSNDIFGNKEMFLTVFHSVRWVCWCSSALAYLFFLCIKEVQVFSQTRFAFRFGNNIRCFGPCSLFIIQFNDFIYMNKSKFGTNATRHEKHSLEFLCSEQKLCKNSLSHRYGKKCFTFILTPLWRSTHIIPFFSF